MSRGVVRDLQCCCCGGDAGRWQQHYNRDKGFGICRRCIDRGGLGSPGDIRENYGIEGVNYAPKETK